MSVYKFDCDCGRMVTTDGAGRGTCGKCGKEFEIVWQKPKVSANVQTAAESQPQAPGVRNATTKCR